jgi:hypothetical protein
MAESTIKHGYVYHGTLDSAAEVAGRLRDWFSGDAPVCFAAFRADGCQLSAFDPLGAPTLVVEWDEGQVFSAQLEARWRKQGAGYALWVLAEAGHRPDHLEGLDELVPEAGHWQAVDRTDLAQSVYLWGQYKPQSKGWIEVRVPKTLDYPVDKAQPPENAFVRLGHLDYRAPNGAVQFIRLTVVRLMEGQA